jgi:hypothetical protein
VVQPGKVSRDVRPRQRQPVLRRPPAQRSGAAGQGNLPRNPSRLSRAVSGKRRLSRVRPDPQREVGRLGRVQRKGTAPDQTTTST